MKIKNNPPRPGIPTHFKDKIVVRYDPKYGAIAQSWPRRNVGGKPRGDPAKVALWDAAIEWVKRPEPSEYNQALQATNGTAFYARDILISAIYGNYISWPGWGWRVELAQNIQAMLDSITDIAGSILYRAEDGWHGLAPGTDAQILTMSALGAFPEWADPSANGITEITGDLDAGPGTGAVTGTLTTTGVTPGTYMLASIQVDAKGRVIDAISNSITPGIDHLTGDVTAGPGSGSQAATLSNTGVTAGTYPFATVTLDAKGRATAASSGSPPAYMNQLTGDVTAGPGSGSQAATLSNTGVTAGTYTLATVTLDAKGRATAAVSGAIPATTSALQLISRISALNVASAEWTGLTGDNYLLTIDIAVPVANTTVILQIGQGSPTTWITNSKYLYNNIINQAGVGLSAGASMNGAAVPPGGLSGTWDITSCNSGDYFTITGIGLAYTGAANNTATISGRYYNDTTQTTGIRILALTGNLAAVRATLWEKKIS